MGQEITQDSLLKQLEDLKARVRRLETAPRMPNTTQQGGTYELDSEDGSLVYYQFGAYTDNLGNPQFGMYVTGDGNATHRVFEIGSHGLQMPAVPIPMNSASDAFVCNTPGFSPCYLGQVFAPTTDAIEVILYVQAVDALSGGQFRITAANIAASSSAVTVSVGDTTGFYQRFAWLHTQVLGASPFQIWVEGKGTGNGIRIFAPLTCQQVSADYASATASGL